MIPAPRLGAMAVGAKWNGDGLSPMSLPKTGDLLSHFKSLNFEMASYVAIDYGVNRGKCL